MSKEFDFLVFIGRMQPPHAGHIHVIKKALSLSNKVVIVLGGHNSSRTITNPFTSTERKNMIMNSFTNEECEQLEFVFQPDYKYNDVKWVSTLQNSINHIVLSKWSGDSINIGLIGHAKDSSSYYLKLFPAWKSVDVNNYKNVNATDIRNLYFSEKSVETMFLELPKGTKEFLSEFWSRPDYRMLVDEFKFIREYKKQWENTPYPVIFHTTDAVVTQAGYVLMVKRKASPGKGLWALPGGFVGVNETLEDSAIRELYEETRIAVPRAVLKGSIKNVKNFDAPNRSLRGRTITTAYHIDLKYDIQLPTIKGSDDAEKARWIPIGSLDPSVIYEDHYSIISHMVGV